MEAKKISESRTIMTEMIMPNDTNPLGNLMGGNLLRLMDIVGAICAGKHCEAYVVTASIDNVSFKKPIKNGAVITLEAVVTRAFNTSLEVYVEVFSSDIMGKNNERCNDAFLTFVAIDENTRKPLEIPGVLPLTDEEEKRFAAALRRRQLRLILAGRMSPDDATEIKSLFVKN